MIKNKTQILYQRKDANCHPQLLIIRKTQIKIHSKVSFYIWKNVYYKKRGKMASVGHDIVQCGWQCTVVQHYAWCFLKKLKLELPHNLPTTFWVTYQKEMISVSWRDTHTSVIIEVLLKTAKIQKRKKKKKPSPKFVNTCMKKMWNLSLSLSHPSIHALRLERFYRLWQHGWIWSTLSILNK